MGILDVEGMLRRLPARKFQDWYLYSMMEPFGEVRADYRSAQIEKALYDINRDRKRHPRAFPIDDFLLKFKEVTTVTKEGKPNGSEKQTWQQKKAIIMMITAAHKKEPRPVKRKKITEDGHRLES